MKFQQRRTLNQNVGRFGQLTYKSILLTIVTLSSTVFFAKASTGPFTINSSTKSASIIYDNECKLDSIAANLLAEDIKRVTGHHPRVFSYPTYVSGDVILIGSIHSKLIASLNDQQLKLKLSGKWECYALENVPNPRDKNNHALVIAGSDFRGTAYGVFEISKRIGVTPWYWWADAMPQIKRELSLSIPFFMSSPPSVKYRGIFINDEDWGLQPWAAKTFEPETGDIGPKTYAKIFELLLRLKANLIWPAMHPSTKPFYSYSGNVQVAKDYQIVVGSSHAEPMLRNNVGEWHSKTMGDFNYVTNPDRVREYWQSRVRESRGLDAIYTIGMRGVHDSGIEGVHTPKETIPLLERIFRDQREMLKKYVNPDITWIPQVFTAYKEVLDVYDAGLKVPDDVTFVWPDDNYGYIARLNDNQERTRAGGSGVYYHVSYWGQPHDYLWLSTTSPGLIVEEMTKAYALQDHNLWVVNVGDIKPAEYNMQLFLDLAYNIKPFKNSAFVKTHLTHWLADNIDNQRASQMANMLWHYYQLAFERKPEFMGWSRTEPITKVNLTPYNHYYYGDQAQTRIDAYSQLEQRAKILRRQIRPDRRDCFYQLVYYPVVSSSLMNKKFLYRDKAYLYGNEGRNSAEAYDSLANAAYQGIIKETDYYNHVMSGGKWSGIMSMHPRDLPVFDAPNSNFPVHTKINHFILHVEGASADTPGHVQTLPDFTNINKQEHFFDLFVSGNGGSVNYKVFSKQRWLRISKPQGELRERGLSSQQRIWIDIDWDLAPRSDKFSGSATVTVNNQKYDLLINCRRGNIHTFTGFSESNGYISIYAKDFQQVKNDVNYGWKKIIGMGATGISVEALPVSVTNSSSKVLGSSIKDQPALTYAFNSTTQGPVEIQVYSIPTHPLNKDVGVRYAISVDDATPAIMNFETFGRSDEWKQAVLSNTIMRSQKIAELAPGQHKLKIYMIDPGVILDRILIDMGGIKPFYGLIPETQINKTKDK